MKIFCGLAAIWFFAAVFMACVPQQQFVIEKRSSICPTLIDSFQVNYIPVADEYLSASVPLDSVCELIQQDRWAQADNYLYSLDSASKTTSGVYLADVLLYMRYRDWKNAQLSLKKIQDTTYTPLKRLLNIDIEYQYFREQGVAKFKYHDYLKRYQQLVDDYPDDALLRKITFMRTRYLRYNY
jgi:hypothetical protein